jgi:hypothetical protein
MQSTPSKESVNPQINTTNQSKLDGLLDYLEQKISSDSGEYLTIEVIGKQNNLTASDLMEIGATPSSLIYHLAFRLNTRMIEQFSTVYLFALGFSTIERVGKYLLRLLEFDVKNIKLKGALHQYSWSLSKEQKLEIDHQISQLMYPLYLEFVETHLTEPQARCKAVWGLYLQALQTAAVNENSPEDCLKEIWEGVTLLCTK